jgi:hypothetical protein
MSKLIWLSVVAIAACNQPAPGELAAGTGSARAPKPGAIEPAVPDARAPMSADAPPAATPLSTPDGLTTVHPLPDFTCEHGEGNVVLCDFQGKRGLSVGFTSIANPVSTEVDELARKIEGGVAKALPQYAKISQTPGTCAAGAEGIETWATYTLKGLQLRRHSCVFVKHGHGHSISYSLSTDELPFEEQRAHALFEAAEFE